jgi:hypothetical protein
MKRFALLSLLVLGTLLIATPGSGYDRWQMGWTNGQPSIVIVQTALHEGVPFMYFTFEVKNDTGKARNLRVSIIARSDTQKRIEGKLVKVEARADFDPHAMKLIQVREKNEDLLSMAEVQGEIGDGETKQAVAIFRNPDPEMDRVEFRIEGLVDPIDVVGGKRYYEKKVLVLHYKRPGDEFGAAEDPIVFVKQEWVVEGERRELPSAKD